MVGAIDAAAREAKCPVVGMRPAYGLDDFSSDLQRASGLRPAVAVRIIAFQPQPLLPALVGDRVLAFSDVLGAFDDAFDVRQLSVEDGHDSAEHDNVMV